MEDGDLPAADVAQLRTHLAALQSLYAAHIAVEDHEVFPVAARVLDRAQIDSIGGEMAARRNVRVTRL